MGWKGKESIAVDLMVRERVRLLCHDDKLHFRAQQAGGIALESDYWKRTAPVFEGSKKIILGYWNQITRENMSLAEAYSPEGFERLRSENGWKETGRKEVSFMPDGVRVTMEANQVDLFLTDLYEDLESRYRGALDALVQLQERAIVKYKPKAEPKERNIQEAMRNKLKRHFKPVEYEHNIIIIGELGRLMMRDLRAVVADKLETGTDKQKKQMHLEENTVYLEGFKPVKDSTRAKLKYYDIGARDGEPAGQVFKLETTLLKPYFKAEGLGVADLTMQPDIQELIKTGIDKRLSIALQCLKEDTIMLLQQELELDNRSIPLEMTARIYERGRTLTERVQELERKQRETDRRLEALEARRKG